jgi:3-hydroxyisobutyrate dehydrogenase-like beta-hydroxyacid dehydrogenase
MHFHGQRTLHKELEMKPITSDDANLGLIGIGYMGRPIARRLLQAGFALKAYDRTRSKAEELARYGGMVADDIAGVAYSSNVLLSCLSNDDAVLAVHLGPGGTLSNLRPGSLVIEMSTVSPETARRIAEQGSSRSIAVLDVTISGSTPAAEEGALVLFGGGDRSRFQAAESIFRAIARSYFYMGPNGSGATTKLVVNALLGIGMQAIAEAVALGEKSGLERNGLLHVLSQTAVVAPAHVGKLQRAIDQDYSPQFPLRLMDKDFGLILRLAAAVGARMPATEAAFEINAARLANGQEEDFSSVILEMEKQDDLLPVQET